EQRGVLQKVGGLMSLLEGHGDVTMDRAGADRIPSAERFSRVLRQRRQTRGAAAALQKVLGLEAKLRQYEQGEQFIAAVEAAAGWSPPPMAPRPSSPSRRTPPTS